MDKELFELKQFNRDKMCVYMYSPTSIIRTSIFRTLLLSKHIVLAMHKFIYSW